MKRKLRLLAVLIAYGYATITNAQITFNWAIGGGSGTANTYAGAGVALESGAAPGSATNWNTLNIPWGSTYPIISNNVVSSLGVAFPGVSITFSNHSKGGAQYVWSNAGGGSPPNPVGLMVMYTFFATYDIVVSGLAPGKYDLWYFGHGDQPNQQGTATINAANGGGTFKTANSALGRDLIAGGLGVAYTNFTGLTVSNDGVFRFTADYLNGFQLQPSQPEGPCFMVTGGSACSAITVGVSGSVATNDYMLYTNGVFSGQTVAGTGSSISFGSQTARGIYTVIATNSATATSGQMYGTASIYTPGVSITTQPTSVTVVTNLPAMYTVAALGDTLSYQWYKNGVPLTNGGNIAGAQTAALLVSPAQAADAVTITNGYTAVVRNPCGESITSSPPAALTLAAPRNLVWVGANPDNSWDHTELNFSLGGSPTAFAEGDNVTFNDSSPNSSLAISNDVTPTLVTVAGSSVYTFSGPNKITGVSQLLDSSSGGLTILNNNDFTGGTVVNNGATLSLGDGNLTANNGSLAGTVAVNNSGTLNYSFGGSANSTVTLTHVLAGNGTVNCATANGSIVQTKNTASSTGFTGTINVPGYSALHGSASGGSDIFGKGSTINILLDGGQAWLDPQVGAYNNIFNIQGKGRLTDNPPLGAIRIFNTTVIGTVNMLADSRIGGSISGGTIRSRITGAYELEVLGTDPGFNLQLGPTNGTHSYSSTRITAGILSALNGDAISTGPLTIEPAGRLRLNGNNLTVASLTTADSGIVAGTGALVLNNNSSSASVLTVGGGNASFQYDGIFGDGSSKSLGLTKVGSGTFTVTAANTNTGPVTVNGGTLAMTGSGSFGNASSIIVGNGAFYSVSAVGGTLALNSGQTLGGDGTVTGNVVASSGSTVAPGNPNGTLTVAGNVALGGGMLFKVNRSLTPNCGKLVSSGGSITGGGSLTNFNIGPALHVGDTFQFFSGGVSGITANLQTIDTLNAVTYTWQSNIASSGSVTVASVTPIAPPTLGVTQSGNTLTFSWTGPFNLQSQTNSLGVGVSTNWFYYPGGTTSPINVPISRTNPPVFYRLSLQ